MDGRKVKTKWYVCVHTDGYAHMLQKRSRSAVEKYIKIEPGDSVMVAEFDTEQEADRWIERSL